MKKPNGRDVADKVLKSRFVYGPWKSHRAAFTKGTRDQVLGLIQATKGYVAIEEQHLTREGPGWVEWSPIRTIREGEP